MKASSSSSAREIAARVIARTLDDGAFAAAALESALERSPLPDRDRAFATELVLGTLRVLPWLEDRIAKHAARKAATEVRAHLLVAAYQLFFLRTPAHAAVFEAVEALKRAGHAKAAGFANAIVRKLAREAEEEDPDRFARALRESIPKDLRDAIARSLGDRTDAYLSEGAPPTGIRAEIDRDAALARLQEERLQGTFALGSISPLAILARNAGRLISTRAYEERAISIQEEGSQVVALALGAKKGERVLDACAGRGQKTAILARTAEVHACDLHDSKSERLHKELARLGLHAKTFVQDWTRPSDLGLYDRVLVDAPCSGTGTLRRRPDIALRRDVEGILRLVSTQRSILAHASAHVRPTGRLVYAVCSVLREEGIDIVTDFLRGHSDFRAIEFDADLAVLRDRKDISLLPMDHGTDGYFLASMLRVG